MLPLLLAALLSQAIPARLATPNGVERHEEQPARVVSIQDGDTITVTTGGKTEKVRLVGIDTPELHDERPEYREARKPPATSRERGSPPSRSCWSVIPARAIETSTAACSVM
jgi:endonuclease YncB( thermonuclease family)